MASREEDRNGGPSDKHGAPVATCNPASPAADAATHSGETDVQVKKSVSFSSPPPSMRSSRDQLGPAERHAAEGEVDESSADETTAIVGQELGGWKDYNTNTAAAASGSDVPGAGVATEGVATQQAEVIGHKAAGIGPRESRQRKRRDRGAQEQDGRQDGDTEAESEPKIGWWRQLIDKYGSVELENKGSVARDHLALERTFLAWLRTSLSFASIGIAVTQLFRLNTTIASNDPRLVSANKLKAVGKPLGATFVAVSIVVLFIGFHRYFESQHYVIKGKFPASRGSVMIISVMTGLLIVASLVVVLAVGGRSFEK